MPELQGTRRTTNDQIKKEDTIKVRVLWGSLDLYGNWYPNPVLPMSADEQHKQNIENGYAI
jgi:hypothetical protein